MNQPTQPDLSGYDEAGYLSESGHLKPEFVDSWANAKAVQFGTAQLTKHQMRAFFNETKRLQTIFRANKDLDALTGKLLGMKAQAYLRRHRKNGIPEEFRRFIDVNVTKVVSGPAGAEKRFEAFVQHFEAVAAYCEGRL